MKETFAILGAFIHVVTILFICDRIIVQDKRKGIINWILVILYSVAFGMLKGVSMPNIIFFIISVIAIEVMAQLRYDDDRVKVAVVAFGALLWVRILDTISVIYIVILNTIFGNIFDVAADIIVPSITVITIIMLAFILKKIGITEIGNINKNYFVFFSIYLATSLVVLEIALNLITKSTDSLNITYILAYILTIIAMFVQMITVMYLSINNRKYKEEGTIVKKMLDEQVSYNEYLEKREEELVEEIGNIKTKTQQADINIMTNDDDGIKSVPAREVLFFDTNKRRTDIHTLQRVYTTSEPIGKLSELLKNHDFYMCHKSYLVNLKKIESIQDGFAFFENGEKAYISTRKMVETKRRFIEVKKGE